MKQHTEFDDKIDDDESYENDDDEYDDGEDNSGFLCRYCGERVDAMSLEVMTCPYCENDPN